MDDCVHGTDSAAAHCSPCFLMKRIAKQAKGLLEAREVYLSRLLSPDRNSLDEAQEVMSERLKMLQEDVKAADAAGLWE